MKRLSLAISLALLPGFSLHAAEEQMVYNSHGVGVFKVRFFDQGDGPFMPGDPPEQSTWNLNQQQRAKILEAMRYWAEVITPQAGQLPAIVNVGTFNDENAAGYSESVSNAPFSLTKLQAALTGKDPGELTFGSHGQFIMGRMNFDTATYVPSQLPRTNDVDLVGVAVHELAHGLGITSDAGDRLGENSNTPIFGSTIGSWAAHLRDDNGNPARAGQLILCASCNNPYSPNAFDVRKDRAYFTGDHVNEVLAGSMRGIPVKVLGEDGTVDSDYMSHIELKNSMMSHQNYRNYTTFMEAELAALQDMGYQIDRRNFFGYSVYGNGQQLVNNHGYFQRNAAGTDYVAGKYNTALLGVGLHLYGSDNVISQQADLLTSGAGGAGVRVDGQNNTLRIEKGVRVYADGINGRGVMFSYGKDHNYIQRGDVQAAGKTGVGLMFDFGNNLLGNNSEYRGSYIYYVDGAPAPVLDELNGALVNEANISGRLAGKGAAIYLSPNALVNNINIMNGAQLSGDIYSDYSQKDAYGQQRLTQLSFGRLADSQGWATDKADTSFRLRYNGNIEGIDNLALSAKGGITSLNGEHKLYSVNVDPGATLGGNSQFTLNKQGSFVNNGKVAPGNSIGSMTVNGSYQQGQNGQLLLEVDGKGGHDTFIVNGSAALDGQLTFAPARDWYANSWTMSSDEALKMTTHSGAFAQVNSLLSSPTLSFRATPKGNEVYQLAMLRSANAYSQYAQGSNARGVGQALDSLVKNSGSGMQSLYSALDFSAKDGSGIAQALNQLTPSGYSSMFASSLTREQQITDIVSARDFSTSPARLAEDEWRSFAIPFGGGFWQDTRGNQPGYTNSTYGIIFGADKQSLDHPDLLIGFHGAISGQSISFRSPQSGSGNSSAFDLGVHARYAADPMAGAWLFGNTRFGLEDSRIDRRISVNGYSTHNRADWTGTTASAAAGGGYRWALNDSLSVGPLAMLDYTLLSHPDITESGSDKSGMRLSSKTFNSLRSSLGVNGEWALALDSGSAVKANLQLTWDHELLDTSMTQNASFVGDSSVAFGVNNQVVGRDSMGVKAGARYVLNKDVELGASVSSDLFRPGYSSVSGNLSASWRF